MQKTNLITIVSALVFYAAPPAESRRLQEFSLYSINETVETYTQHVRNLNTLSPIVRDLSLQSVCSQKGVWAFFTGQNFSTIHSYGYHPAASNWTCSNRRIMADYKSPFQSIRHLGNKDLDQPSLSLYDQPFFAGEELYFDGQELSWPSPRKFSSFGFTGSGNWTLFSESDWQGESVCLLCKCDREGLDIGVTYTAKLSLSASALRRGCHSSLVLRPNGQLDNITVSNKRTDEFSRNDQPTLRLHNSTNHQDGSLLFSGTELRLPCYYSFDTFSSAKQSNWTLFDSNGNSTCIAFPINHEQGYENSLQFPSPITVSSIQFGCKEVGNRTRMIVFETPVNKTSIATEPPTSTTTPRPLPNIPDIVESEDLEGYAPPTTQMVRTTPQNPPTTPEYTSTSPDPEYVPTTPEDDSTTHILEITRESVTSFQSIEEILSTSRSSSNSVDAPKSNREGKKLDPSGPGENEINGTTEKKDSPLLNSSDENVDRVKPTSEEPVLYYITTEAEQVGLNEEEGEVITGGNIFFISFLVVLGLLTLAMISAIIGFIYFRGKNSGTGDVEGRGR